ncbi:MAG: four helix bundle protein [bacterium]|nr:four helix bundle protein [bacterium]
MNQSPLHPHETPYGQGTTSGQPSLTQHAVGTWKLAHRFVLDLYKVSSRLPHDEREGLVPMLRGGAMKVASNIVAGHARKEAATFSGHASDAAAALEETKYALLVARDLGYLAEVTYDRLMADAELLTERLEELRGRLGTGKAETPPVTAKAADTGLDQPSTGEELPFLPADRRTFAVTKGVGSTVKDLWGWLRGASGRVSGKHDGVEGRIWTEDSSPNYLEQPDDELARR